MGYPMSYKRMVARNNLEGSYQYGQSSESVTFIRGMIAGDLRRVETDQRDERHLAEYAKRTGLPPEHVKAVLDLFFEQDF